MSGHSHFLSFYSFLFLISSSCSAEHEHGALLPSNGSGVVKAFGGLSSYISASPHSKAAVILISDIYGYENPKLRQIADKVAASGFYAVIPDFFFGDPYVSEQKKPLSEWLKEHRPDEGFENTKPVIKALKSKGITKIGAAGFCWGGKVAVELANHPYMEAGVLLHPTFVTLQDIQGVKVPLCILGGELDKMSPPELLKQFEAALKANHEIQSFVKIFPGVSHGWTLSYDDHNEEEVKSALEAHQDMLDWFLKYLN